MDFCVLKATLRYFDELSTSELRAARITVNYGSTDYGFKYEQDSGNFNKKFWFQSVNSVESCVNFLSRKRK